MSNGVKKRLGFIPLTMVVVLTAVVTALLVIYIRGGDPPPEDRPPIVVLDGSIIFQGGDTMDQGKGFKPWKHMAATSGNGSWRPDHDRGAGVTNFTATIGGNLASTGCSQTTLTGDSVTIDFVPDPNAPQTTVTFTLAHAAKGGGSTKQEPDLSSTEAFTDTSGTGVPQIEADSSATAGYISKVTVGTLSCALAKPDGPDQRKLQRVTIQPNR